MRDTTLVSTDKFYYSIDEVGSLFAALWIFTPWYVPVFGPSFTRAFGLATTVSGSMTALSTLPAFYAVKTGQPKDIAFAAFVLYLFYLFTVLTRIIFTGFAGLSWLPSLILALVLMVVYIEQRHVARRDAK